MSGKTNKALGPDPEFYRHIKKPAKSNGQSATEYMRETVLDRLEDQEAYLDAVQNLHESDGDGETVSREQLLKDLGLL